MIGMIYGNNREDKGIRENDERKRRKWHLCYSKNGKEKKLFFKRNISDKTRNWKEEKTKKKEIVFFEYLDS